MESTVALWQVVLGAVTVTAVTLLGVWRMQAAYEARVDARIAELRAELRGDINAVNQRLDTLLQMLAARRGGAE